MFVFEHFEHFKSECSWITVPPWHSFALSEWEHGHFEGHESSWVLWLCNKHLVFIFGSIFVVEHFMHMVLLLRRLNTLRTQHVLHWASQLGSGGCVDETGCFVVLQMFAFKHFKHFATERSPIIMPCWHGFALCKGNLMIKANGLILARENQSY
jgi:hypothetical protein